MSLQHHANIKSNNGSDLLRRHIRIYHPQKGPYPPRRVQKACSSCHKRKERCDGGFPCNACQRRGIACSSADGKALAERDVESEATASKRPLATDAALTRSKSKGLFPEPCSSAFSCDTQVYIDIYFKIFHPAWPFLYCSSFDLATEPPILVQSMIMIVLWIDGDLVQKKAAINLHDKLCLAIHDQMVSTLQ
jgi:hypothetical protein